MSQPARTRTALRRHVQEEEKEWFPLVRKAMGRAPTDLGARMAAAKGKAPADPLKLLSADA